MLRWIPLILAICLTLACGRRETKRLIPQKKLIPLLVDLHVTDALAVNTTISDQFGKLDSTLLYSTVLESHGYTKDQLFTTLDYYTNKPEILMEIYDEVFAMLSARSEEAKAEYNKYSSQNTRHIWRPKQHRFKIIGDTVDYPVFDSIEIDSKGTYILNLSIKINKADESVNPTLVAYFYSTENDNPETRKYFEKIELHKSKYARELMLIYELRDSTLNHMRIIPVSFENADSVFYRSMEMYSVRLSQLIPNSKAMQRRK